MIVPPSITKNTLARVAGAVAVAWAAGLVPAALAQDTGPVDADRVVLRFSEGAFELVGVSPVTAVLPPSDALPGALGELSGFWFELQSSDGEVRYRRVVGDPVRLVFEGPDVIQKAAREAPGEIQLMEQRSRGSERTLSAPVAIPNRPTTQRSATTSRLKTTGVPNRQEGIPDEREFSLLMPRAGQGDVVLLFGAPIEVGNEADAAVELARVPLQSSQ